MFKIIRILEITIFYTNSSEMFCKSIGRTVCVSKEADRTRYTTTNESALRAQLLYQAWAFQLPLSRRISLL
jgi:hypothetical protein